MQSMHQQTTPPPAQSKAQGASQVSTIHPQEKNGPLAPNKAASPSRLAQPLPHPDVTFLEAWNYLAHANGAAGKTRPKLTCVAAQSEGGCDKNNNTYNEYTSASGGLKHLGIWRPSVPIGLALSLGQRYPTRDGTLRAQRAWKNNIVARKTSTLHLLLACRRNLRPPLSIGFGFGDKHSAYILKDGIPFRAARPKCSRNEVVGYRVREVNMADLSHTRTHDCILKNVAHTGLSEDAALEVEDMGVSSPSRAVEFADVEDAVSIEAREQPLPKRKKRRFGLGKTRESYSHTHYKVYKRRWIGLGQLVLLNIVVSWDWLTFAPISTTSSAYFSVSESTINWLSTAFLFAFAMSTPLTIYLLHRGPKPSIIAASILLLVGNWIRYAGTKTNVFSVVMVGQILTGLAQPFVLAAPTRYSDMWFTEEGRIGATALASLANPFGAALASLINPFLGSVPTTVLIVSCIATAACIPSLFIPSAPPSPPSASSAISKTPVLASVKHMLRTPSFYLIFFTFGIYTGFFNAFTSLLNQVLYPYGYTEDEAGICGAVLIVVGLVAAAASSPIVDRTHAYLVGIKILCPLLSIAYLAMIWAPQTRTIAAPYVLSGVLGACSFSLLPIALEYLVEITFPASPEVSSTICWVGGQVFGGIFIVIMNALKDDRPVDLEQVQKAGRGAGAKGGDRPPGHMYWALVFQAVICALVLPLPLMLGVERLGFASREGRLKRDVDGDSMDVGAGERGEVDVNGGAAGAER